MRRVPVTLEDGNMILQKVVDGSLDVGKLAMIGKVEYRKKVDEWTAVQRADIADVDKELVGVRKEIDKLCEEAVLDIKSSFEHIRKTMLKHEFDVQVEINVSLPCWRNEKERKENKHLTVNVKMNPVSRDDGSGYLNWNNDIPISEGIKRLMTKRTVLEERRSVLCTQLNETEMHKEIHLAEFGENLEAKLYEKRLAGQADGGKIVNFIQALVNSQVSSDQDEVKRLTVDKDEEED
jgi:hypothetical protein